MKDLLINILLVWPSMAVIGYALIIQPVVDSYREEKEEEPEKSAVPKKKRKRVLIQSYYRYA
jgi:hypothetical protein